MSAISGGYAYPSYPAVYYPSAPTPMPQPQESLAERVKPTTTSIFDNRAVRIIGMMALATITFLVSYFLIAPYIFNSLANAFIAFVGPIRL
jgi:hypothetical protein